MEKNTLLAIALSILVLVAFSYLSPRKPVQKPKAPEQIAKQAEPEEQKQPVQEVIPAPALPVTPLEEKEIKVETSLYSAVFTTRGGTIKRWELKKHTDSSKGHISLVPPDAGISPVSVIPEGESGGLSEKFNYAADTDRGSIILNENNPEDSLTFLYSSPEGLTIKKKFTLYKDDYKVYFATEVSGVPAYYVVLGSRFGIFDEKGAWVHIGPSLLKDSSKIDIKGDNLEGISFIRKFTGAKSSDEVFHQGNIKWIAQEDKYFASMLASLSRTNDVKIWKWAKEGDSKKQEVEIAYKVIGEKGEFLLYAGPKKYERLKAYGAGLEHIIDFGFFSIIARPLFWLLKFLYGFMGNYGWAIVLLTIITRIPFIPLLNKSQKSMKKLQDLQPHMAAIKEQHKKDPQRMQKEMMGLYKKHKVNPVGGCLPMLIQLPVFLALYKILLIAIELRGAPFILWVTDLAAKDPYYIFPILMGITMVIQQKITPTSMDPKQAKMMMFMPIIFTFMFLSFPAGLVLYWLVNNTLGIIQQVYINKKVKTEK